MRPLTTSLTTRGLRIYKKLKSTLLLLYLPLIDATASISNPLCVCLTICPPVAPRPVTAVVPPPILFLMFKLTGAPAVIPLETALAAPPGGTGADFVSPIVTCKKVSSSSAELENNFAYLYHHLLECYESIV